jgi:hypothetical protein
MDVIGETFPKIFLPIQPYTGITNNGEVKELSKKSWRHCIKGCGTKKKETCGDSHHD